MTQLSKRAWGEPLMSAFLRVKPEDFVVDECLDLPPDDTDTHAHLWLQVQKRERNTQDVASLLADIVACPARDVGFAGLKDRRAVTRQWFSLPVNAVVSLPDIALEIEAHAAAEAIQSCVDTDSRGSGITVLAAQWRARKLRRGAHAGNRFEIVLRDVRVTGIDEDIDRRLLERVAVLRRDGFPNAFGPQRFGAGGRNLSGAQRLLSGGAKLRRPKGQRQRHERGMLLSAARSSLFNAVLDARLAAGTWLTPLAGEPLMLSGSNSRFVPDVIDDEIRERIAQADLSTSGPMPGRGATEALHDCEAFESSVLAPQAELVAGLIAADVDADRRALRARADDLVCRQLDASTWSLHVTLTSGVFATSLLRELGDCQDAALSVT